MVQEEKPPNDQDEWNPYEEEDDENGFPEEIGPPENNIQLMFQDLAMHIPRKFFFFFKLQISNVLFPLEMKLKLL